MIEFMAQAAQLLINFLESVASVWITIWNGLSYVATFGEQMPVFIQTGFGIFIAGVVVRVIIELL